MPRSRLIIATIQVWFSHFPIAVAATIGEPPGWSSRVSDVTPEDSGGPPAGDGPSPMRPLRSNTGTYPPRGKRHIARWRSVKHVTTFVEQDGEADIVHHRERWTNELRFVYAYREVHLLFES